VAVHMKGLRMQVVVGDELLDLAHQIGNGLEGVAANGALVINPSHRST